MFDMGIWIVSFVEHIYLEFLIQMATEISHYSLYSILYVILAKILIFFILQ